jgi:hypothetical protein
MYLPLAITKKRLTITPAAATKRLDITPISHSDTTYTLPFMQKQLPAPNADDFLSSKSLNLSFRRAIIHQQSVTQEAQALSLPNNYLARAFTLI